MLFLYSTLQSLEQNQSVWNTWQNSDWCIFLHPTCKFLKARQLTFACFLPGLGSMFASSSKWGRSLLRLAGSPVLCSAIVSSCTLWAKDAGVCSCNERKDTENNGLQKSLNNWSTVTTRVKTMNKENNCFVTYLIYDRLHMWLVWLISIQQRRPLVRCDAQPSFHGDLNNLRVMLPPQSLVRTKLLFQLHERWIFIPFGNLKSQKRENILMSCIQYNIF